MRRHSIGKYSATYANAGDAQPTLGDDVAIPGSRFDPAASASPPPPPLPKPFDFARPPSPLRDPRGDMHASAYDFRPAGLVSVST